MNTILHAVYDGEVLRPEEPVQLEPNTRVRVTVEPVERTPMALLDYFADLRRRTPRLDCSVKDMIEDGRNR